MTLYIPLDASNAHPNSPSFLVPSQSPESHLTTVIKAILKAKRIAVVCGAGISVEAGIPDFRSHDGLFQSLKRDNPKENLLSGKELFDATVFKTQQKTALFYRMIARLSSLSSQGQPTAFHRLLRILDDRGQLLRVYTQNIDALEMKAGLSFGVPVFEEKELRVKLKGKAKVKAKESGSGAYNARLGGRKGTRLATSNTLATSPADELDTPGAGPSTPSRRLTPTEPETRVNVIPRCIPLHGTLLTLHCQHCTQSFPLSAPSPHIATTSPPSPPNSSGTDTAEPPSLHAMLARGTPPPCPSCTSLEETRALVGKRLRGVGKLRPSVVLYGEEHREGEGVGEVVRRDLFGITDAKVVPPTPEKLEANSPSKSRVRAGKGPDLLLVVGTSLRVPGTKRIVREFSKAVRPPVLPSTSQLPTPKSSPPAESVPSKIQTVYLNLDFPSPAREWEGVFDAWVNGDVQAFAKAVQRVIRDEAESNAREKQCISPKRNKLDGVTASGNGKGTSSAKQKGKRKADVSETPTRPTKKRKLGPDMPPTPTSLPRLSNGRFGHPMRSDLSSPSKVKRVILRLPPPPVPSKPSPKRRRSIPEVVITTTPAMFSRKSLKARSLSPLTSLSSSPSSSSLSSLTPPPPLTEPTFRATVNSWRRGMDGRIVEKLPEAHHDLKKLDEEDDIPLATAARLRAGLHRPPTQGRSLVKYPFGSKKSR